MTEIKRIINQLKKGVYTVSELSKKTGVNKNTVSRQVQPDKVVGQTPGFTHFRGEGGIDKYTIQPKPPQVKRSVGFSS